MVTQNGTRFELELSSHEGALRAVYQARVHRPEGEFGASVEITPSGARVLEEAGGPMPRELSAQLVAIAKTLGKRAEEGGWPRRINRWRQPGVR